MWAIIAAAAFVVALGATLIHFRMDPRQPRLVVTAAIVTALVIAQVLLVVNDTLHVPPPSTWSQTWVQANFGFAVLIGLLVGATELIGRYKDEPFAPLLSLPGSFYALINGGASALAYYLLLLMAPAMSEPLRTFTAGIAAMAFFRSALFNVRLGGADVPVGPNLILLTVLKALDRTYDRARATPRSAVVREIVGQLSFSQTKDSLPALCFELMQNLSPDEVAAINTQVTQLSQSTTMNDRSKMLSLGLALLNLIGESTLRAAVETLGTGARAFLQVDQALLLKLAVAEPEVVLAELPKICAALLAATPQREAEKPFVPTPLDESLPVESRVVLLAYQLVNYYGSELVTAAANLVGTAGPAEGGGGAGGSPPTPPRPADPPPPPAAGPSASAGGPSSSPPPPAPPPSDREPPAGG